MSYSKSINAQLRRKGSLFQKTFKRKLIDASSDFPSLVTYIHKQISLHKHTFATDLEYPWSSYNLMLLDKSSKLKKQEVIDWFGGRAEYLAFHEKEYDFKNIEDLIIEED